jgi:uncharacterized protein
MRVAALYRYPLKGFTAESRESLAIVGAGRVAGDRALAFRFADSATPGGAWTTKHEHVALVNTPGLARLKLTFDDRRLRLRITSGSEVLVEEALDDAGRGRIAAAIQDYVLKLAENPLSGSPHRLPVRLVGDGVAPRYQDDQAGLVTLHSRESLAALAATADSPGLSEMRFRSNIAIEGVEAWEEQSWIGRRLQIGQVAFDVVKPKARCLATHANPATGERDIDLMRVLPNAFAAQRPTFAVAMSTVGAGGVIRVGDEVRVLAEGNSHRPAPEPRVR